MPVVRSRGALSGIDAVIDKGLSEPGASHMPPAAVTSTMSVMRGLVSAMRSRAATARKTWALPAMSNGVAFQ